MTTQPAPIDVPVRLLSGPTVLIEYAGPRFLTDPTFDPLEGVPHHARLRHDQDHRAAAGP